MNCSYLILLVNCTTFAWNDHDAKTLDSIIERKTDMCITKFIKKGDQDYHVSHQGQRNPNRPIEKKHADQEQTAEICKKFK